MSAEATTPQEQAALRAEPKAFAAPDGTSAVGTSLSPRYTFDSFVVGSSNQFVHAACQAVAELPSRAYNPLFIYGGAGLGKTHLLHALGQHASNLFPRLTAAYLSSERFTIDLIDAIRYDRTAELHHRYRTIDLLLIDDIQFISGKERTQEEFLAMLNDLYTSRKQIVLSSDCPPKDILAIDEALRSRFEWGLVADIQPPGFSHRVAILKKKAAIERIVLPEEAIYEIARRVRSNVRQLEGALLRIIARCALTGEGPSLSLASTTLSALHYDDGDDLLTLDDVQAAVAGFFKVAVADLTARHRAPVITFARQISMYLSRQLLNMPLLVVAKAFGYRDHTSAVHAINRIQSRLLGNPETLEMIETLTRTVRMLAARRACDETNRTRQLRLLTPSRSPRSGRREPERRGL